MGEVLALSALLLFSMSTILTKVAASKLPLRLGFPVSVAVNILIGGTVFLVHAVLRPTPVEFHVKAFFLFMAAGAFSVNLGRWFFFRSIDLLGPAKASAFQVSNVMFTVVIAWITLGETLSLLDFCAIATAIAGLTMVSYVPGMFTLGAGAVRRWSSRSASPRGKASAARVKVMPRVLASGVAIAVISASSYAIAGVLRGAAVRQWNEPVLGATLGGLLGMVIHFVAHGSGMTTWRDLRSSRWSAIAYYGVIGVLTIIAQTCMIASMRFIPVSISNLITMATPIVVTPASFFLLKNQENIRPLTVLGILLVLSGIGLLVFF